MGETYGAPRSELPVDGELVRAFALQLAAEITDLEASIDGVLQRLCSARPGSGAPTDHQRPRSSPPHDAESRRTDASDLIEHLAKAEFLLKQAAGELGEARSLALQVGLPDA